MVQMDFLAAKPCVYCRIVWSHALHGNLCDSTAFLFTTADTRLSNYFFRTYSIVPVLHKFYASANAILHGASELTKLSLLESYALPGLTYGLEFRCSVSSLKSVE